jgi:hypothetical protein
MNDYDVSILKMAKRCRSPKGHRVAVEDGDTDVPIKYFDESEFSCVKMSFAMDFLFWVPRMI